MQRAFSLLELMVVVAIVGVLSSLALSLGSDTVRQARAREEKEAVRSLLIQARNHARRSSACVRVTRVSSTELQAALFVGTGCASSPAAVEPTPSSVTLTLGTIGQFDVAGTPLSTLTFFSDGSTRASGPAVLRFSRFDGPISTLQVWPGAGIVTEEG